jgi:putative acetyltransferase
MIIRSEIPSDIEEIRALVTAAFKGAPHTSGTEAAIVDALRDGRTLTISLVADADGELIGQVAFSPVSIDGKQIGWYGLGPVTVRKDMQRSGIGKALINVGIERLTAIGAQGCVVLGDPAYYSRFGFESDPYIRFPGVPEQYFQRLKFNGQAPSGIVEYHAAFY